jgi:hypothetical protein
LVLNLFVKQTSSFVFVDTASHLVFSLLPKVNSKVLPSSSCGKFVPVKVRLSCPNRFKGESSETGVTAVSVHSILAGLRASSIGTLPKNVVRAGFQSPQTGSLSRAHTTSVPLRVPSASDP